MLTDKEERRRTHAYRMYMVNKAHVEANIDRMSGVLCAMFAKAQDELYLRSIGERK